MSLLVSVFAGVHLLVFVSLCVSEHVIVVSVFAIPSCLPYRFAVFVLVVCMSVCTSLSASVCMHHLQAHVCLAFSVSDTKYAFTPMQ